MAERDRFLRQIWVELINSAMDGHWLENALRAVERDPTAPFADLGPVIQRLLGLGASQDDLNRLVRWASYESAFGVLSLLDEADIDEEASEGMHEELLSADSSGHEGRPGSWPLT